MADDGSYSPPLISGDSANVDARSLWQIASCSEAYVCRATRSQDGLNADITSASWILISNSGSKSGSGTLKSVSNGSSLAG